MNEDFIRKNSDGEEDAPSEVRKPLRRARRTVAPFAEQATADQAESTAEEAFSDETQPSAVKDAEESESSSSTAEQNTPETEESTEASPSDETTEESEEICEAEKADKDDGAESEETSSEEKSKEEGEKLSPVAEAFDWIKSFLFSLTAVIFIFTLIFRGVTVNGGSMLPTLENAEYLIISDLFYTPKTGDIVVVQSPHYKNASEPLIKRIIATDGQTVKINFTTWEVWVDGELLQETYILRDGATSMNCEDMKPDENGEVEFKVEENCIFVMGDHRNDSLDSRSNSVGQIDERYIMGRVVLRLTPLERFGKVE